MQLKAFEDRVEGFLEKKFRYSRSFGTKNTYRTSIKKFDEFLREKYGLDVNQVIVELKEGKLNSIDVLDQFFTYLTKCTLRNGKVGYSNSTIIVGITAAKEFLNDNNLHIYTEDLKQRFKLPKKENVYEEGLTKEILSRLLHNSSPKLQTAILMCVSSGMRIGELVQLRLGDIDFKTNPTTIRIRKETTKSRETRFTCISGETTKCLKDYLRKNLDWYEETKEDKFIFLSNNQDLSDPKRYHSVVSTSINNLEQMLVRVEKSVPELSKKNENGRNSIHFHSFRAWFKTQVTDSHQSDFAEALMGHKSLKLVYYRQNTEVRSKTYLGIEHSLTVSDFTKMEKTITEISQKYTELETKFHDFLRNCKENKIPVPDSLLKMV